MARRQHFYKPLVDEAGDLLRYASIFVYEEDGVTPYDGVLYRDESSGQIWQNPFIAAPALVEFYIDGGARLILGVTVDENSPELKSEVIDVFIDVDEIIFSVEPLFIYGDMPKRAILGADMSGVATWRTLRIDHEHAQRAPDTVYLGSEVGTYQQVGGYLASTVVGTQSGGWGASSSLRDTTMLGNAAIAYGRGAVALGHDSYASERIVFPYEGPTVAIGAKAAAQNRAVAIGPSVEAWNSSTPTLGIGRSAFADGKDSVALGVFGAAGDYGVSIGWNTGQASWGHPGSIGLGADAQFGLPSATTPDMWSVLLGSHDPAANRAFPWANPKGSQSESWLNEYTTTMAFTARTVQFQRHLTLLLTGSLQVAQDVTLGREESLLGFYGATPQPRKTVGDDEPGSGLTALDNLIYALRDIGLLQYRTESLANYQATDLEHLLRQADCVDEWPEHHGRDVARLSPDGQAPNFDVQKTFDEHPAVAFYNSTRYTKAKPKQSLISENLIPQAKHFLTIAKHNRNEFFGYWEGMLNLYQKELTGVERTDNVIFQGRASARECRWASDNFTGAFSIYAQDNCDQTRNLYASLDHRYHAWRATHNTTWGYARMVIGGPHELRPEHDYWQGFMSEVVAMDKTWTEAAVRSMTVGLMFKYRIAQDDTKLYYPAKDFIVRQHQPIFGVTIGFKYPYPDDYCGKIEGWVRGLNKPRVFGPFVSIFSWFDCYDYCGPMAGYWSNIPNARGPHIPGVIGNNEDYAIKVTSISCNQVTSLWVERLCGEYKLSKTGMWNTKPCWVPCGYKRAYLYNKHTCKVIARSDECQPTYYDDVEVRIYTRAKDGTLIWRETSILWGDATWCCELYYSGVKVARLYEKSTGKMLATTEWDTIALPRYTVIDNAEPGYSEAAYDVARIYDVALAVLALVECGPGHYPRARHILATLARIANSDGSLNESYLASYPVVGNGTKSTKAVVWAGLAALQYQKTTGDKQYQPFINRIAFWLHGNQKDGSFFRNTENNTQPTDVTAAGYFFFRNYAETV